MRRQDFDVIVIGLGVMGGAAAYHLAGRGWAVLGLDARPRGHEQGSSHGRTRIIREAYYEAPEYVPLVRRAYALWRSLEEESGRTLLRITGGLSIGSPTSGIVAGAIASANLHGLAFEELTPNEVSERFPGFQLPGDRVGVFQPNSGVLFAERCLAAHLELAERHGATLVHGAPVLGWTTEGDGVMVTTATKTYRAARLVITAGAWSGELLTDLDLPLTAQRVVNAHFEPVRPELFDIDRCPIFSWDVPEGRYYGLPFLPGDGLKLGRHDGGEEGPPSALHYPAGDDEIDALRRMLERYMPGAAGPVKWSLTCLYPNSIDRHFIIDRHPEQTPVVFGCGFSGHGFKFASVVGEIFADLAINGQTEHPIGFLSARRFATRAAAELAS